MDNLLHALFPSTCRFCRCNTGPICSLCLNKHFPLEVSYTCLICGRFSQGGFTHKDCLALHLDKGLGCLPPERFLYLYAYTSYIRNAIIFSKYSSSQFALLGCLTKHGMSHATFLKSLEVLGDCVLVPVPLSRAKYDLRGFNQVDIICQEITKYLPRSFYLPNAITRERSTKNQHLLGRALRFENLKGAFAINKIFERNIKSRPVLLVDDIATTGATFMEISTLLYRSGVSKVIALALSRRFKNQ